MAGILSSERDVHRLFLVGRRGLGPSAPWKFDVMTRHCHQCGWEWPRHDQPGRSESCERCGADLHVCLNCVSYDPRAAWQCRDRRAEPVAEKHVANFCEYFEFAQRVWTPRAGTDDRAARAREQLKKLLGD